MSKTIPMIEARKKLTQLPEAFERKPETGAIAITRRGKPVLAVMSWDLYESIVETLEIMSDEAQMASLRQGLKEMKQGKLKSWEQVKKELSL